MGIILPGTDEVIGPGEHRFPYQDSDGSHWQTWYSNLSLTSDAGS